jgi:hypothetical protein
MMQHDLKQQQLLAAQQRARMRQEQQQQQPQQQLGLSPQPELQGMPCSPLQTACEQQQQPQQAAGDDQLQQQQHDQQSQQQEDNSLQQQQQQQEPPPFELQRDQPPTDLTKAEHDRLLALPLPAAVRQLLLLAGHLESCYSFLLQQHIQPRWGRLADMMQQLFPQVGGRLMLLVTYSNSMLYAGVWLLVSTDSVLASCTSC